MIDIKELIADRLRRDPAFRIVRDSRTGNYYLQNQVVLRYERSRSADEAARLARQYVDETNQIRQKEGKPPLRLTIVALSKSIVIANGRGAVELKGTGPTPMPPPPPPPWRPGGIWRDRVYVIQVLSEENRGRFDVIASSYALAAGIAIDHAIEDIAQ